MGIVFHHYISPYSFVMGVLWFNAFILLGLFMRKLRFPVKFSVIPLLLLLILSVLRMIIAIEIPGAIVILSETFYPAIVNFSRYEIVSYRIFALPISIGNVFIFVWVIVSICLISRYLCDFFGGYNALRIIFKRNERDEYAESILAEIIGSDKYFRVYRNGCFSMAIATAVKPYIILPRFEFPPDELRAILLHEWKHIQDKDYLTGFIINIICFVFWWNPLIYVLRNNFCFAKELKCDHFAVSKSKGFENFLSAILLLDKAKKEKVARSARYMNYTGVNTLINAGDEITDRLGVLALRGKSRGKRILTNVCYSIVAFLLFFASYMLVILPAFWSPSDIPIVAETFVSEYREGGGIFKAGENFFIDNGDGTFSLYINGQFVVYVDETHEFLNWLPVHMRRDS